MGMKKRLIIVKISPSPNFNNFFMEEALQQAQIAFDEGEIPVGAVIVNRANHKIIAKAHNMVEQANNALLHAEIIAINQASSLLANKNLSGHDIYVTLEPCLMCAAAIAFCRINRLFYGTHDPKQGGVENGGRFFNSSACFHYPEIYGGFSEECSKKLIQEFFKKIRQE